MRPARKITVEVPRDLPEKAQRASGAGISQTIRKGLNSLPHRGLTQATGDDPGELLSDPELPIAVARSLSEVPLVNLTAGFWRRAGSLRARVLAMRRKARLGDALIAQCCVDHGVALITRDRDFQAFAAAARLTLWPR